MSKKIIVIGGSIAGVSAAEAARKQDPEAQIIIFSHDSYMPYYRLRICEILNTPELATKLYLHAPAWYEERRIEIRLNHNVVGLDPVKRRIQLDNGQSETYDSLVIASGSQSFIPPIHGIGRPGVYSLWTLDDAIKVAEILPKSKHAVVIGGGLLGLEAAYFARKQGLQVTIIERANRLLANQLDEAGSAVFLDRVKALDIDVKLSSEMKHIHGVTAKLDTPVSHVYLTDGRIIETDLVLVCIGVRANIGFLDGSGIAVQRRIVADTRMETSAPDVYAAGDAAEPEGYWFGLWSVSKAQGMVAGTNAAGGDTSFEKVVPPYVINTMETKIVVQGDKGIVGEARYDLDALLNEENGTYKKLIYRDGIFSGFILIGDTSDFTKLQKSIGKPAKD
jgi:nitrite reductase (NADH) large subunit